jgi:hypothetical protein
MTSYTEEDKDGITALLVGRRVTKVYDQTLRLDNGTQLRFEGNEGGCICGAGDYELVDLNGVDNVITKVEFEDSPSGDDRLGDGYYKIFVFADNVKINLATFEGTDGNGYYGTGYSIQIVA